MLTFFVDAKRGDKDRYVYKVVFFFDNFLSNDLSLFMKDYEIIYI